MSLRYKEGQMVEIIIWDKNPNHKYVGIKGPVKVMSGTMPYPYKVKGHLCEESELKLVAKPTVII
jgi:hypothetical protein